MCLPLPNIIKNDGHYSNRTPSMCNLSFADGYIRKVRNADSS
jgi:hypothetical protein